MPIAIPDHTCRARVFELLDGLGVQVRSITPDAAQWIVLCCDLSVPPEVTSTLYCKMAHWATLAETVNLEGLPSGDVAATKADFFLGKISMQDVKDHVTQLAQRRQSTVDQ